MTATVSQVLGWSIPDLDQTAARLASWERDVDWLTTQFTGAADLGDAWRGRAGSAAAGRAVAVAGDIENLVGMLGESSRGLSLATGRLLAAQDQLRAARSQAAGLGLTMNEDGTVPVPPFVTNPADSAVATALAFGRYVQLSSRATRVAQSAHQALDEATYAEAAAAAALVDPLLSARRVFPDWVLDEAHRLVDGTYSPAVQAARDMLATLVADPGDDSERLRRLLAAFGALTDEELSEFFAHADFGDLAALEHLVGQREDSGGWPWSRWHVGLSDSERNDFLNNLLSRLDLGALRDLRDRMGTLETDRYLDDYLNRHPGRSDLHWADLTAPVFHGGANPIDPVNDVNQGGDGDCWFLTSLNAIAQAHPDVLVRNLTTNGNGTYTVRFYVDGHWVPVTVLPDVPHEGGSGAPFYASEGVSGSPVSWVAIYEKAYAQLRNGYRGIYGGWPKNGMATVLGPDAQVHSSDGKSDSDIDAYAKKLAAGTPMAADTDGQSDKLFLDPAGTVVGRHAYAVVAIDPAMHTVKLRNPWGPASGPNIAVITVSYDDFRTYFTDVSWADVKK